MKPIEPQGPFCQSCGMPLAKPQDFGITAYGIRNNDYCSYCYVNGAFVSPDFTMEQMRDFCVSKLVEGKRMSREKALVVMNEALPRLKRWSQPERRVSDF